MHFLLREWYIDYHNGVWNQRSTPARSDELRKKDGGPGSRKRSDWDKHRLLRTEAVSAEVLTTISEMKNLSVRVKARYTE